MQRGEERPKDLEPQVYALHIGLQAYAALNVKITRFKSAENAEISYSRPDKTVVKIINKIVCSIVGLQQFLMGEAL